MPRSKFKGVGGDFKIEWGKHNGRTFDQIKGRSFRYIIWLAGWVVTPEGVAEIGTATAREIGIKSQLSMVPESEPGKLSCKHCVKGEIYANDDGIHQCTLAGDTLEDTLANLTENLDCLLVKAKFGFFRSWMHVTRKFPGASEAARRYLEENQLCLNCGKIKCETKH